MLAFAQDYAKGFEGEWPTVIHLREGAVSTQTLQPEPLDAEGLSILLDATVDLMKHTDASEAAIQTEAWLSDGTIATKDGDTRILALFLIDDTGYKTQIAFIDDGKLSTRWQAM